MAQEVRIAGATYSDVPSISVPDSNNVYHSFVDTSPTTATDSDVASGKIYFKADGTQSTGTASGGGGGAISVVDTTDAAGGIIRTITAVDISDTTATASDVASGKYFYTANGTKTEGTASGGGGAVPWFGVGNATLLYTANYDVKLSDTNYSSLTPSTSSQYLTLPATAYSSAGTSVTYDEYSCSVDLTSKVLVFVIDCYTDMAYTTDESTMGLIHQMADGKTAVFYMGRGVNSSGATAVYQSTINLSSSRGFMISRSSNNTSFLNTTALYGVFTSTSSPGYTMSGNTVIQVNFKIANCGIRASNSYMETGAFAYIDAANTHLKHRTKLYMVDAPGPATGQSDRLIYMVNNGSFPVD